MKEAALTKEEIRILSEKEGLPTWNKPSFACLATRFPYGTRITEEKLRAVEAAEQLLFDLGFLQFRVRCHGISPASRCSPLSSQSSWKIVRQSSRAFMRWAFATLTDGS